MHVIFRETQGLEETETPMDLGQTPADLVVLSFSDSDLGAFAQAWREGRDKLPTLRLANLVALKHPLSVDTYVEQTLIGAKGILIRLIGGVPYWEYGLQQVYDLALRQGIALAVLPADGRVDERLDAYSTLPVSTLRRLAHLCDGGGAAGARAALAQMALASGLYAAPVRGVTRLPTVGLWSPEHGVTCPVAFGQIENPVVITFYRSFLVAADLEPIKALFDAFRANGRTVVGLFAPSLKQPEAASWIKRQLQFLKPAAIVNATSFSGRGVDGTSPLDATEAPVFQVALSTARVKDWKIAERGLSPADLAMHVVLPEVDGRVFAGIVSAKEPAKKDHDLEYARFEHTPVADRIDRVVSRVEKWISLQNTATPNTALVLSTYPGKAYQIAHAVGLDAIQSCRAIVEDAGLGDADLLGDLGQRLQSEVLTWSVTDYTIALKSLPIELHDQLHEAWGDIAQDQYVQNGEFQFPALWVGNALIALQPERGWLKTRYDDYHDLSRTPCHGYVAFYLWLQSMNTDAMVHIGAHGTLEWLPGKSVALSNACWPDALAGDMPIIYPFIVNDPGEAAQAKRRIAAVTLGHIPPPLAQSHTPDAFVPLENLLDEFSNADGLDPKRRDRLMDQIRDLAQSLGVEQDLGISDDADQGEALTRIDRFVCDIKEAQFADGLHVFGRMGYEGDQSLAAQSEQQGLRTALCGRRIDSGPAGSPYRGRSDVLPTGRNLFSVDPLSVPSRAAYDQGCLLADELVRRHLQDHGDWPKSLVIDLWGSATMRTAGEEFAMALALLGVRPVWAEGSERITGTEIIPLAEMDRPRIDATLRVSGLFRDVFPTLSVLYNQAVRALAARDEAPDWNPFTTHDQHRVFGPAPGEYGVAMQGALGDYSDAGVADAGTAWLAQSSWSIDGDNMDHAPAKIAERVRAADTFVHLQDLAESDVLMAADYAAHEAGFAAAKAQFGQQAILYHLDTTNPSAPKARTLKEEIAKTVMARAANPDWISGMMRHGFRGGAEMAATLDHMGAFANLAKLVEAHHFDRYFQETLGRDDVVDFLREHNPQALNAMIERFDALAEAGLWITRRNSISSELAQLRQSHT